MAQAKTLSCPSCGSSLQVANSFVRMVVCRSCSNTLTVRNISPEAPSARPRPYGRDILSAGEVLLDLTGKTAGLASFPTQLGVGRSGRIRGKPFRVLGRVRFEEEDGYWDEWYLEFEDGHIAWLEEEEGELVLSQKEPLTTPVPDFESVRLGATIIVSGQPFFVTERCRARVTGAEGQLYYRARIDQPVRFLDGNIGGRVAFLEYGDDEIEYSTGEPIERDEIALDRE